MGKSMERRNVGEFFLFLIIGFVLGGFLTSLGAESNVRWLQVLNYGYSFGMLDPCVIDLGVMTVTLGLSIRITFGSLVGCVITSVIYRKVMQ